MVSIHSIEQIFLKYFSNIEKDDNPYVTESAMSVLKKVRMAPNAAECGDVRRYIKGGYDSESLHLQLRAHL